MEKLLNTLDIPQQENYILPFFWMKQGFRGDLTKRLRAVYDSGVRAVCLESRTHEDFCGEDWWGDLSVLFQEADRLGMRIWILDDKRFPTGYANGLLSAKYPERRKWHLVEHHADIIGPMREVSMLYPAQFAEDELLGVYLYQRSGEGEALLGEPIDLTAKLKDNFVTFDLPEGLWRIFFFFKSRKGSRQTEYIHLIDEDSVRVLIEAVYEPHYERLRPYFGNVLAGFFSDEPSLGNGPFSNALMSADGKAFTVGMPGLALPWSDRLFAQLDSATSGRALSDLALLWYPCEGRERLLRFHYMNILTKRYRDAFSRQLGDWCRERGVEYIGHIIEDMNAHARMGNSCGHYFRSMDGQDMSGMDIVLHQIQPGFAHWIGSAICSGGKVDPEFYHYALTKLCSSMARLNHKTRGRAMCEVFGAYGWAESVPMMKWLIDHLLVRGINHFIPHAFSPDFPNPDCPPHFDADGNDPQYPGFCKLMRYTNKVASLLRDSKPASRAAILYHAENEWMNGCNSMLMQVPAKALTEAWIEFEFVPADYLADADLENNRFRINGVEFRCLLIPYARTLPPTVSGQIIALMAAGVPVYMVCENDLPQDKSIPIIMKADIVSAAEACGCRTVRVEGSGGMLRIGQFIKNDGTFAMLFNESVTEATDVTVHFEGAKEYRSVNLLTGEGECGEDLGGGIPVRLEPYESRLLWLSQEVQASQKPPQDYQPLIELEGIWRISAKETGKADDFAACAETSLVNITGPSHYPDFSGVVRYETTFVLPGTALSTPLLLELGNVGMVSDVTVNGQNLGLRICPPYRYNITGTVQPGENTLQVEVANTLVHRVKDRFSAFLAIPPSGLLGPVTIKQGKRRRKPTVTII